MAKKKSRNISRRKDSAISITNIILFILLMLAVLWIFMYPSMEKISKDLKKELHGELG